MSCRSATPTPEANFEDKCNCATLHGEVISQCMSAHKKMGLMQDLQAQIDRTRQAQEAAEDRLAELENAESRSNCMAQVKRAPSTHSANADMASTEMVRGKAQLRVCVLHLSNSAN